LRVVGCMMEKVLAALVEERSCLKAPQLHSPLKLVGEVVAREGLPPLSDKVLLGAQWHLA